MLNSGSRPCPFILTTLHGPGSVPVTLQLVFTAGPTPVHTLVAVSARLKSPGESEKTSAFTIMEMDFPSPSPLRNHSRQQGCCEIENKPISDEMRSPRKSQMAGYPDGLPDATGSSAAAVSQSRDSYAGSGQSWDSTGVQLTGEF